MANPTMKKAFVFIQTNDGKFHQALLTDAQQSIIEGVLEMNGTIQVLQEPLDGLYIVKKEEKNEK